MKFGKKQIDPTTESNTPAVADPKRHFCDEST
jgi:hypothetical protein